MDLNAVTDYLARLFPDDNAGLRRLVATLPASESLLSALPAPSIESAEYIFRTAQVLKNQGVSSGLLVKALLIARQLQEPLIVEFAEKIGAAREEYESLLGRGVTAKKASVALPHEIDDSEFLGEPTIDNAIVLIEQTITAGASLYNAGNVQRCAELYRATGAALTGGFTAYTKPQTQRGGMGRVTLMSRSRERGMNDSREGPGDFRMDGPNWKTEASLMQVMALQLTETDERHKKSMKYDDTAWDLRYDFDRFLEVATGARQMAQKAAAGPESLARSVCARVNMISRIGASVDHARHNALSCCALLYHGLVWLNHMQEPLMSLDEVTTTFVEAQLRKPTYLMAPFEVSWQMTMVFNTLAKEH